MGVRKARHAYEGHTHPGGGVGPAGPAGLTWQGDWSSAVAYVLNDAVYRSGSSYRALASNTNSDPALPPADIVLASLTPTSAMSAILGGAYTKAALPFTISSPMSVDGVSLWNNGGTFASGEVVGIVAGALGVGSAVPSTYLASGTLSGAVTTTGWVKFAFASTLVLPAGTYTLVMSAASGALAYQCGTYTLSNVSGVSHYYMSNGATYNLDGGAYGLGFRLLSSAQAWTPIALQGSAPLTTKGDLLGFDTGPARVPVGVDGRVLTADSTQPLGVAWGAAPGSVWTTYTPPVSGTGWALGNGVASGYFTRIGDLVVFEQQVQFGTTSTFGTGQLTVGLPVAKASLLHSPVEVVYIHSGAPQFGFGQAIAGTQNVLLYSGAPGGGAVTATVPFTWAPGDAVRFSGSYRAA